MSTRIIENSSRGLTADEAWFCLLYSILSEGETRSIRGTESVEILGHRTVVDMATPVVTCPRRKLGYKFQAAEAHWILTGDDSVRAIEPYSKTISQFSDDGVKFFGAYGPKIASQVDYVVGQLESEPGTRRAVINIWRENPPETKDYPCTLSLQLLTRDGRIHCVASMRSSDAWLGWPYDVFNFSMVSLSVALKLKSRPRLGNLYLTAGSQHVYYQNLAECRAIVDQSLEGSSALAPESPRVDTGMFASPGALEETLRGWFHRRAVPLSEPQGSLEGLRALHTRAPRS